MTGARVGVEEAASMVSVCSLGLEAALMVCWCGIEGQLLVYLSGSSGCSKFEGKQAVEKYQAKVEDDALKV